MSDKIKCDSENSNATHEDKVGNTGRLTRGKPVITTKEPCA
jgi:hypothetical protein